MTTAATVWLSTAAFSLLKWSDTIDFSWWWLAAIWLVCALHDGVPVAVVSHAYNKRPSTENEQ